ncbi:MAG: YfiR family protein [Comamonas sp.]|nr:YfiR family protein [Comamonas sp.]
MEPLLSYCKPGQSRGVPSLACAGRWAWLLALCLAWTSPAVRAEAEAEDHVQAVTRTVLGILGYTRWPADSAVLHLCVTGATAYAAGLMQSSGQTVGGQRLDVRRVEIEQLKATDCEGIYLGDVEEQQWRNLMRREAGRPLLTISERSALCRIGAMFCLRRQGEGPGFEVNLDSVARSGLRISPKVLQLARSRAVP